MALRVYGTLRPRNSARSTDVIQVMRLCTDGIGNTDATLSDCCLDLDWLDENTFASCGADMMIFIMRVNDEKPIKTLVYVFPTLYKNLSADSFIHFL